MPCLLQSRPISLDGVVFAVIGRVVHQPHTEPGGVGKLRHTMQKLAAPSIAFGTVVQIDNELLDGLKLLASLPPP